MTDEEKRQRDLAKKKVLEQCPPPLRSVLQWHWWLVENGTLTEEQALQSFERVVNGEEVRIPLAVGRKQKDGTVEVSTSGNGAVQFVNPPANWKIDAK